jgi:hypothetical protein
MFTGSWGGREQEVANWERLCNNADPGKAATPKSGNNADREKELSEKGGRYYFDLDSSVTSVEQFAATMAGAMTIPTKARAIKKSCMISVPDRRSAELGTQPVKAPYGLLTF